MSPERRRSPGTTDPGRIDTADELAAGLRAVMAAAGLTYRSVEDAARRLEGRPGRVPLPRGTLGDLFKYGRPSQHQLITFLQVCRVAANDLPRWLLARERVLAAAGDQPPGFVRITEADPRLLGVQPAIATMSELNTLPAYVARDVDPHITQLLTVGATQGAFLLLLGGSSVGKTRTAYHLAVKTIPTWWLFEPNHPDEVRRFSIKPRGQTVIWLDDLQNYLGGSHGLTAGVARRMLQHRQPIIILATMWPTYHASFTSLPTLGQPDQGKNERDVLRLAHIVDISAELSSTELDRAREVATRDPRIKDALSSINYGMTQILAAAPQLVRRWENAPTPFDKAMISAAVDARRLGVRSPLDTEYFLASVDGYLDDYARGRAGPDWFEHALSYATEPVAGAVAALPPIARRPGGPVEYGVADFLLQHAARNLRCQRIPSTTWDALINHAIDLDDLRRVADNARRRGLICHVVAIYHRVDRLLGAAASTLVVEHLAIRSNEDFASDDLVRRASVGDSRAAMELAQLLIENDDTGAAIAVLRQRAEGGDPHATRRLIELLEDHDDTSGVIAILEPLADRGDSQAAWSLANILAERLEPRLAMDRLRKRADKGDVHARRKLGQLPTEQLAVPLSSADHTDHTDRADLRRRARAGDANAAWALVTAINEPVEPNHISLLRMAADAGISGATARLVNALADQLDTAGLFAEIHAGTPSAIESLANALERQGNYVASSNIRRFGLTPDGSIATSAPSVRGPNEHSGIIARLLWPGETPPHN